MFGMEENLSVAESKLINPIVLAFVGDAVYSLYVRKRMAACYKGKPSDFQRTAGKVVSAHAQSEFLDKLLPLFTDEEKEIFLRARNAKKGAKSKNADVGEYNRSTGFEAVLGFLYISGQTARLDEIFAQTPEEFFVPQSAAIAYKP
ncbi:MAG: ribonuclease III [Clostridia bacterium]|nr:ribonuclease III [Clostridia bacterium]